MRRAVAVLTGLCVCTMMGVADGGEAGEGGLYPHAVELRLTVEARKLVAFEPLIARIDAVNRDVEPLTLRVGADGALPLGLECLLAKQGSEYSAYEQRLSESTPGRREVTLHTMERTGGDILILFGAPPTGFAFAEPGWYRVKFAWRPDARFAPIYSREVRVQVSPDDGINRGLLDELGVLARQHFGWDPDWTKQVYGERHPKCIGAETVLKRAIKHTKPLLLDPERNPADKKEAELVELLAALLERHPDSAYSGYIARYLGLVHLKTFEHEGSVLGHETWDTARCQAHPDYQKALQYLTVAKNADLWPRTTALENLAFLHTCAQEWERVTGCVTVLRTEYADVGGTEIADRLHEQMTRFRAKLEARSTRQGGTP